MEEPVSITSPAQLIRTDKLAGLRFLIDYNEKEARASKVNEIFKK